MEEIVARVQELTDIELAILICLVANEHCIIQTDKESLDTLQDELQLVRCWTRRLSHSWLTPFYKIASDVFALSTATVHCSASTTLEELSGRILIAKQSVERSSPPKVP